MPSKKEKRTAIKNLSHPSFDLRTDLTRYIDQDELKRGRVTNTAFIPNPGENYLSVNSLELESIKIIADYYRSIFQQGSGKVAIIVRKIIDYNDAARSSGISIIYNRIEKKWQYNISQGNKDAYKYRPTRISSSHCGVEFINNTINELVVKKIARRLARKNPKRPHLFSL